MRDEAEAAHAGGYGARAPTSSLHLAPGVHYTALQQSSHFPPSIAAHATARPYARLRGSLPAFQNKATGTGPTVGKILSVTVRM